jgi:hypothetical protein
MNRIVKKATFWTPRVICILFALFLVIFSFDVFGGGRSAWEIALALLMHNLPTIGLFIMLYFAWRREWIGTVVCTVLGILYIVWARGRFPFITYLLMVGPLFLLAILFLVNWIYRAELRPGKQAPASLAS